MVKHGITTLQLNFVSKQKSALNQLFVFVFTRLIFIWIKTSGLPDFFINCFLKFYILNAHFTITIHSGNTYFNYQLSFSEIKLWSSIFNWKDPCYIIMKPIFLNPEKMNSQFRPAKLYLWLNFEKYTLYFDVTNLCRLRC